VTVHEVEFILDEVLQSVVDAQPEDHPLRRVDRDNSLVYETGEAIDMQAPMHDRTEKLKQANYVGVATETTDPSPSGTHGRYQLQTTVSVRLEGLTSDEWGHIDPDGYGEGGYGDGGYGVNNGVSFSALFDGVFGAITAEMSYPDVNHPGRTYRDLTITNVNDASSEWSDFHRASFDVLFRGYTDA